MPSVTASKFIDTDLRAEGQNCLGDPVPGISTKNEDATLVGTRDAVCRVSWHRQSLGHAPELSGLHTIFPYVRNSHAQILSCQ